MKGFQRRRHSSILGSKLSKTMKFHKMRKDVVQSIETFKFKNKLEAVVYTFIVSQLLTTDERANFIEIF
jgi:hypothetical protein